MMPFGFLKINEPKLCLHFESISQGNQSLHFPMLILNAEIAVVIPLDGIRKQTHGKSLMMLNTGLQVHHIVVNTFYHSLNIYDFPFHIQL